LTAAEPLQLSFEEAIRMALLPSGQARLQLAAEAEREAESQVKQARAGTGLQLSAGLSDRVLRFDLRSIGIDLPQVSPFVANVALPNVVGPFTVLDSEVHLSKTIVNRSAGRQIEAARESAESVRAQSKSVAAEITAQTAKAYLDALRAKSDVDLAAENVSLSQGRFSLANERRANGLVTGGDVRRANLDVAEARQALFAAQTSYRSAILQLVALIGVPFDTAVELTEQPVYRPEDVSVTASVQAAFRSRPEIGVADLEMESLRLKEQAIAAESRPTLAVFADAGALTVAPTPNNDSAVVSSPTYTAGFEFRLPILDGGRRASAPRSSRSFDRPTSASRLRDGRLSFRSASRWNLFRRRHSRWSWCDSSPRSPLKIPTRPRLVMPRVRQAA
jgi:outer membrane protein